MLQREGRRGGLWFGDGEDPGCSEGSVLGVCRLYCSQVWTEALKQAGLDASFDLWKTEHVLYPPTIREDANPSSEVRDFLEEVEAASSSIALTITSLEVLAKESSPSEAAGMDEGQDPDAPKETIGSIGVALVSHVEGPVIVVEPLQSVPLGEGSKDPKNSPAQLSEEGVEAKSKE